MQAHGNLVEYTVCMSQHSQLEHWPTYPVWSLEHPAKRPHKTSQLHATRLVTQLEVLQIHSIRTTAGLTILQICLHNILIRFLLVSTHFKFTQLQWELSPELLWPHKCVSSHQKRNKDTSVNSIIWYIPSPEQRKNLQCEQQQPCVSSVMQNDVVGIFEPAGLLPCIPYIYRMRPTVMQKHKHSCCSCCFSLTAPWSYWKYSNKKGKLWFKRSPKWGQGQMHACTYLRGTAFSSAV